MIELGGNINLKGFNELEPAMLIVVKKMVGNFTKRISTQNESFEALNLHLKGVHKTEKNQKYEVKANLIMNGKDYNAEEIDYNLFFALNRALEKVEAEVK